MIKTVISCFCLLVLAITFSCKKNSVDASAFDKQEHYFGWEKGKFVEYEVTSIFHDSLLAKHDTIYYQLRTVIGDTFIDNSGRVANEFLRYRRLNATDQWEFTDKWTGIIADNKAQLVEENQRIVKMVFKPSLTETWDANMYNLDETRMAKYLSIDVEKQFNNFIFPKTTTVEFYRYKTLIDDRYESETYAENVGLIEKTSKDLYFKFGSTIPMKGKEVYYRVINFGSL